MECSGVLVFNALRARSSGSEKGFRWVFIFFIVHSKVFNIVSAHPSNTKSGWTFGVGILV